MAKQKFNLNALKNKAFPLEENEQVVAPSAEIKNKVEFPESVRIKETETNNADDVKLDAPIFEKDKDAKKQENLAFQGSQVKQAKQVKQGSQGSQVKQDKIKKKPSDYSYGVKRTWTIDFALWPDFIILTKMLAKSQVSYINEMIQNEILKHEKKLDTFKELMGEKWINAVLKNEK